MPKRKAAKKKAPARAQPPKPFIGRPTLLTPERSKRLLKYLREGNYLVTAARGVGIHVLTLNDWMKRGRAESWRREQGHPPTETETIYLDFFNAALDAQAEGELSDISKVRDIGKEDWHSIRWIRSFGQSRGRWGHKQEGGLSGFDPLPEPDAPTKPPEVTRDERSIARELLLTVEGRDLIDRAESIVASRSSVDPSSLVQGTINQTAARGRYLEETTQGTIDAGFEDDHHDPASGR